eukprot:TRINITY_DN8539_c0_g1_i4.p1 TRINITY_DN8539_c0_g1~~TRINITY_DN8539_c0_g1_i4.p1  ORF type:complete len:613 (-),score=298.29 TRINITY_DN8539_c0_g1_i4:108-1946(-)
MPFVAQPQEKCEACKRTVFATEKMTVEETGQKKVFHKTCLRCVSCNVVLSLGNYSGLNGQYYCKPHFKQLFKTKGNYDEGFGGEKHSAKWEPAPVTTVPNTFVPVEESVKKEKDVNQTSSATSEKFKKFREEGETNKCESCSKSVYAAERLLVEDKSGKRLFHKTCFKCSVCNLTLDLRNYGSKNGVIYCKNHLKEAELNELKEKSAAGASTTNYVPTATTFVPVDEPVKKEKEVNQSSSATSEKFKKFREEGETNKCESCSKSVYAAERLLVEDKSGKRLFHKTCFKCSVCNLTLDLRNYGSKNGVIYCKNHLKEAELNELKEKSAGGSSFSSSPKSFVPEVGSEEKKPKPSTDTPDHIASKFKSLGTAEKCKACGKSVYATEKIVVEELNSSSIYHKACLKCTTCNVKVDLSTFGSSGGVIYCKTHLKKEAAPEMAKVAFDPDAPLTGLKKVDATDEADRTPVNRPSESNEDDDYNSSRKTSVSQSASNENQREEEEEKEEKEEREEREEEKREEPAGSESPVVPHRNVEEEKTEEEKPKETHSEPSISATTSASADDEEAERERRAEERKREREERKKQAEAEAAREEEERQRRNEERRKRLEAAKNEE